MKYFFANKTNIFLSILLLLILGIGGYVIFGDDLKFSKEVIAIDYSDYTKEDIEIWCNQNKLEVSFTYEFSEEYPEGKVISQLPLVGEAIEDTLQIVISKGEDPNSYIELPEIKETTTREELEKFFEENGFTDVTFEYQISDKDKNVVISLNKTGKVKKDELIKVYLSGGKDNEDVEVVVPDFKTYSITEAKAWASANAITIQFVTDLSDTIQKGAVISQSVAKGTTIKSGSSIKIVISDGKGIEIPDFKDKSKTDVEKWKNDNGVESVTYLTQESETIAKDKIISTSPKAGVTISSDYPVKVYISTGAKAKVEKGYEGKSVNDLKKYLDGLDLLMKDSGNKYYSDKYENGTVYSYDTGSFSAKSTINYSTSLGKYTVNLNEYNGKTKDQVNSLVNTYNNKNAGISIQFVETETDDANKIGKTFDCSSNNKAVSCKLGYKKIPQINASEYNGLIVADATNKMNTYKSSYGQGSLSTSYGVSGSNAGKTYDCSVEGKNNVSCKIYRGIISADEYNGLSQADATNKMATYKNTYGVGSINFNNVITDEHTANQTFGCSLNDTNVTCSIAVAPVTKKIMKADAYTPEATYELSASKMQGILGDFKSLQIVGENSEYTEGVIFSVQIKGPNEDFHELTSSGNYRVDLYDVKVVISTGYKN